MMAMMIGGNAPDIPGMMKGQVMAKKKVEVIEELDELEELEEVAEEGAASGEMLTAKQAASMLKTDGRTLRKFLRKKHGTVGQGQRWAIDAGDIDSLRKEFEAYQKGAAKDKADKADAPKKPKASKPKAEEVLDADDDIAELEEIDDLDFDDID